MPTPPLSEREIDIYIAKHLMNLDVLGLAPADNYNGWSVYVDGDSPKQPVYLRRCVCELTEKSNARFISENPELEWTEPKLFGHCVYCLDVVPMYSQDCRVAYEMEAEIAKHTMGANYLFWLGVATNSGTKTPLYWMREWNLIHASPLQRATACYHMLQELNQK